MAPFGQTLWFLLIQLLVSGSNDFPSLQIQFGNIPGPFGGHSPSNSVNALPHL